MKPIIKLDNVGVCYNRRKSILKRKSAPFWALKNINLDIYRGESLGIIGHNGAGKSTLLRVIAGIVLPNHGTITCKTNSRIGILSMRPGFNPNLSGRQNIILGGLLLGVSKEYIYSQVNAITELSGLAAFIDQPVNTYSSGMAARLGFATSYFCAPDVLMIDETLGVGDKAFKKKSAELIQELIHSDRTVIVVSHSRSTMDELCNRTIELNHGVILKEG